MCTVNDHPFRFARLFRIRRQADFDRVFAQNVYAADRTLVVQGCLNGLASTRLGLSVSRRTGNAVVRNRLRRLVREIFRAHQPELRPDVDIVLVMRPGAARLTYQELETRFLDAARRSGAALP